VPISTGAKGVLDVRAVIVGAGKLGCGYLCLLFRDAGWDVVLSARTPEQAERIRSADGFDVRITGSGATRQVRGVAAVATGTPAFEEVIASADLVVTCVGVRRVRGVGPSLARALAARNPRLPLQVWVAENQDCAPLLEESVRTAAAMAGLPLPPVGFTGAVAEVTVGRGSWRDVERPLFVGNPNRCLWVDESRLIAPVPRVPGVELTPCYRAQLQQKLFVFNAGHALCAYLGVLRGHRSIDRAIGDRFLRPLVAGSMLEARRALASAYPSLGDDVHGCVANAIRRFEDAELADPVDRVARDPIRKLRPHDRLVGAAQLVRATLGRVPCHFALGIAGALLYRNENDEEARRLRRMLERKGLAHVLGAVCGLQPDDELAQAVSHRYRGFILTANGALFPPVYEPGSAMLQPMETAG
jgi:mannitol-1-phosphate 5-dehydrogenase